MPLLELLDDHDLRPWFHGLVPADRQDLLAASHYLVFGPEPCELLRIPTPEAQALTELLRLAREQEDDDLYTMLRRLAAESPPGRRALCELAVDQLVVATFPWRHPSQVLDRPRPAYVDLAPICRERLVAASAADRRHLEEVVEKIEKAARISEEARVNRQRMRQFKRRKRRQS